MGKDVVSRVWRKVKTDWAAWTQRDLAQKDIVRLILSGSAGIARWLVRPALSFAGSW